MFGVVIYLNILYISNFHKADIFTNENNTNKIQTNDQTSAGEEIKETYKLSYHREIERENIRD